MVNASELRLGNLLLWNPKLTHPQTTLLPMVIEVVSIAENKIGYISPGMEHRAEPFEDDVLQLVPKQVSPEAIEPILLTAELLAGCGFVKGQSPVYRHDDLPLSLIDLLDGSYGIWNDEFAFRFGEAFSYVHHLQNVVLALTKKQLQVTISQPV